MSPAERRRWLEDEDSGVPIATIRKNSNRDGRTFDQHLATAREEREARAAKRDQIRRALDTHSAQLLEQIERFAERGVLTGNERLVLLGVYDSSSRMVFSMPGLQIDRRTLEVEVQGDSKLQELLEEHLPEERELWNLGRERREMEERHAVLCIELGQQVANELERSTDLKPINEGGTAIGFHESMLMSLISRVVELVDDKSDPEQRQLVITTSDPPQLVWGGSVLVRGSEEQLSNAVKFFEAKLNELPRTEDVREIAELEKRGEEIAAKIRDRADELALFPYISGTCRACKKFSL